MVYNVGYPKTIYEQIDDIWAQPLTNFWALMDANGNIILPAQDVLAYLQQMYGNYKTRADLAYLWSCYGVTHNAAFHRAWEAWSAEYNPLDNYNGSETNVYLTNDGDENETITHGKTTTVTANSIANKTDVTTFDSNTFKPEGQNTQTGSSTDSESGTTTTRRDRTSKSLTVDDTTYTADNVHAEIKKRSGNLGVTTSQQMITSEVNMRLNPLFMMYLDNFIADYAYCILGEWSGDSDY